jgi:hypothetical protein
VLRQGEQSKEIRQKSERQKKRKKKAYGQLYVDFSRHLSISHQANYHRYKKYEVARRK